MKLSVSLSEEDVAYLDSYAKGRGLDSRSAALQRAIRLLREAELGDEYEQAWSEWNVSEDASLWDQTLTDGLR